MRRSVLLLACVVVALAPASEAAAQRAQLPVLRPGARGPAVALLQVALSDHDFGSGPIDGRFGPELSGALRDYQAARGLSADGVAGPRVWRDLRLEQADPETWAFRTVVVEAADTTGLGPVPEDPAEQARLPVLAYGTILERLGERYQASAPYLTELNPEAAWPNPPVGTAVRVPGVSFRTFAVLPQRSSASATPDPTTQPEAGDSAATSTLPPAAESDPTALKERWEQRAPADVHVEISAADEAVRVFRGDELVARYPATVGSDQFPNPVGEWKVVSQVYAPDYRYDPQFLETGRRSETALRLPPGPNSLVGLLWMGLNKDGYGVHGTDDPESIGTRASHGCVRLTNWDVERLAKHIGIGTIVRITDPRAITPSPPPVAEAQEGRGSSQRR